VPGEPRKKEKEPLGPVPTSGKVQTTEAESWVVKEQMKAERNPGTNRQAGFQCVGPDLAASRVDFLLRHKPPSYLPVSPLVSQLFEHPIKTRVMCSEIHFTYS
jgi:hypothetical protein